jgi:excisionase family DNA binding protein
MEKERLVRLLLRPAEVAEILGLGRSQAYEMIATGVLPSVRLGKRSVRVPVEALKLWVAEQMSR